MLSTMAPHDHERNIFGGAEPELPVVLPHHLFMMAVASAASKGSSVCPTSNMENIKTNRCSQPNETCSNTAENYSDREKDVDEEEQAEGRMIIEITCDVEKDEEKRERKLSLLLRFEDKMNRQLSCSVAESETGEDLANELVQYGLISELDRDKVATIIDDNLLV